MPAPGAQVFEPQRGEQSQSEQPLGFAAPRPASGEQPFAAKRLGKRPSLPAKATQPRADALHQAPTTGAALRSAFASWNCVVRSSASFLTQYSESVLYPRCLASMSARTP